MICRGSPARSTRRMRSNSVSRMTWCSVASNCAASIGPRISKYSPTLKAAFCGPSCWANHNPSWAADSGNSVLVPDEPDD